MEIKMLVAFLPFVPFVGTCVESTCLEGDWLFRHESEAEWRPVRVPHDWSAEFAPRADAPSRFNGGFYTCGKGEYRRKLALTDGDLGKSLSLFFEGVYRDATVEVNGEVAGRGSYYGYTWFRIPLGGLVHTGTNEVVVKVDNSALPNCRWYAGSGIFRKVWLEKREPEHLVPGSVNVRTAEVSAESARVVVSGTLTNVASGTSREVSREIRVESPVLWSPETPRLYDVEFFGERVRYGIRTVAWSARDGFLLNGRTVKLHGACVHHDHGPLGAASYDAAEVRKVCQLRRAGFNAVRTSHAPVSEAFLDACDAEGLLVIDDMFDGWRTPKLDFDYSRRFEQDWRRDLTTIVSRDRRHPSVVVWSIGNEVRERGSEWAAEQAGRMAEVCRALSPGLPVTSALNVTNPWRSLDAAFSRLDIAGYNYMEEKTDEDHGLFPSRVIAYTETYPADAVRVWRMISARPYVIGEFVWTGIDYLGEAAIGRCGYTGVTECGGHGEGACFPWHGSACGDIDLTGWRKPISHLRETLWNDTAPTYLAVREPDGWRGRLSPSKWSPPPLRESWSFYGWEGKPVTAEVYTRRPRVRLLLNGEPVGERDVSAATAWTAVFDLRFGPGELRAEALDSEGNVTETCVLRSAGAPASIRYSRERIGDLEWVTAEVVDDKGTLCPDAAVDVTFEGDVLGTCSADPCDLVPLPSPTRRTWCGRALAVVRCCRRAKECLQGP